MLALLLTFFLPEISGHGRLIDPPSRASAWRYGFNTPHNYNDHELYCGGFTRQWIQNGGKCGVCGDAWDAKTPRPHEFGGTYGQGVIVRKYTSGSIVNLRVELTASHFGYFTFSLCPDYKHATQQCLDKHVLRLVKPQEGVEHHNVRYYPKEGNRVYEMKYKLPKEACPHCLLQWRYIAGNNWGTCANGTGGVGCGPQEEFRACADVEIVAKDTVDVMETSEVTNEVEEVTHQSGEETSVETPTSEPSQSPVMLLVMTFASFLVVCLVLFLLFFHFYQVGSKMQKWMKGKEAPRPPPRSKRRAESVA